jgi:hypothetical protein
MVGELEGRKEMGVDVAGSNCWHSHSDSPMEYEAPILTSEARGEANDDVKLARRRQPSSLNEGYTDHASCIMTQRAMYMHGTRT